MNIRRSRQLVLAALLGLNLLCVGLASALFPALSRPLLFGVALCIESMFFMMFLLGLARLGKLHADHPAFLGSAPAIIIAQMEHTRSRLIMIDLIGGALALLLGIACLLAVVVESPAIGSWRSLIFTVGLVAMPLGFALIAHSFTLLPQRAAYEYARQAGTPATARVLKVTKLLGSQRSRSYDKARRYQLELEVQPPGGAPYQATIEQLIRLHPLNMPAIGSTIAVKYLPDQPRVVVALLDPEEKALFARQMADKQ
jgi:MFS family permease